MKRKKLKVLVLMVVVAAVSVTATLALQEQRTRRVPQFDNERVKVWKSIILPNQPLRLHRHENGRALIALTDGKLDVVNADGETVDVYDWKAGNAYWLDADPEGALHGDLNKGPGTIEVIVVELQN